MDLAVRRFAHEIVNDVFIRYKPKQLSVTFSLNRSLVSAPVLYNKRCKHIVNYYFTHYKDNITKYYTKECENFDKNAFSNIARKLIFASSYHHQCSEVFYRLSIQIALLGVIAHLEGCPESLSLAIQEIIPLANDAYLRCDLDDKYDYMFNFSFDVLKCVFDWAGCEVNFDFDFKRLDRVLVDYFTPYKSFFNVFLYKEARPVLNKFNAVESNLRAMTREAFVFRIQDCCDNYYMQLGRLTITKLRIMFLEICMYISLLALHAFEALYPSDFRLAHERILRLAILTARYGIINPERLPNIEKLEVITVS